MNAIYMAGLANAVIPFEGNPIPLIGQIRPSVILRGEDQTSEGDMFAPIVHIPRLHGFSTTEILNATA